MSSLIALAACADACGWICVTLSKLVQVALILEIDRAARCKAFSDILNDIFDILIYELICQVWWYIVTWSTIIVYKSAPY